MTTLNLSNQAVAATAIKNRTDDLKALMDARLAVWKKLPDAKKKAWITSGKDPVMTLAWGSYKYLRDNFFGQGVDDNG